MSRNSRPSPRTLYEQLRGCVLEHGFSLEQVLPLVTGNTSRVLKLGAKGALESGKDADVVVMRRDSLEIVEVIAGGRRMVAHGRVNIEEPFLKESTRRISLHGTKHENKQLTKAVSLCLCASVVKSSFANLTTETQRRISN